METVTFWFKDGKCVDIDVVEFGTDRMGANLDRLAVVHGGVAKIEETARQESEAE